MKGIEGRRKTYVRVRLEVSELGEVIPQEIIWRDGRRFVVDALLDRRPAASLKTGGRGIRYIIRVGRRERELWEDEKRRWFVEEIIECMPD